MEDRNWGSGKITRLFVRAIGWEDVAPVVRQIPAVVRANQDAPYLVISTQDDQLDRIKTTFMWVEALLWLGIVASLMLGGFGIWYGTFAAVRARTREVGLKKGHGQFGQGHPGPVPGRGPVQSPWPAACWASWWAPSASRWEPGRWAPPSRIRCWRPAVPAVFFFSAIIGVAGGLYPAIQASRMDVVSPCGLRGWGPWARSFSQKSPTARRAVRFLFVGVNIEVEAGELVAIMGPSGCGKSTMLHVLGMLHAPDSGTLEIPGTNVLEFNREQTAAFRRGQHGLRDAVEQYVRSLHGIRECGIPPLFTKTCRLRSAGSGSSGPWSWCGSPPASITAATVFPGRAAACGHRPRHGEQSPHPSGGRTHQGP